MIVSGRLWRANSSVRMVIAGFALTALAGCGAHGGSPNGGHDGPTDGARRSLQLIATGMEDHDGPRVCSLLYRAAQEELMKRSGGATCIDAVATAGRSLDASTRTQLGHLGKAEVHVNDGVAQVTGPGTSALMRVLNLKGLWVSEFEDDWMVQGSSAAPAETR